MSEFNEPAPYDYEDGLRDRCVNDPLWAADEIEELRSEIQRLRQDIHALTHRPAPTYYGYR